MLNAVVVDEAAVLAAVTTENATLPLTKTVENNTMAASMLSRASRRQTFTWKCSYCPAYLVLESFTAMMAAHHARLAGWSYTKTAVVCPDCNLL